MDRQMNFIAGAIVVIMLGMLALGAYDIHSKNARLDRYVECSQ